MSMTLHQAAKLFLLENKTGMLSTHSVKHEGYPFASIATFWAGDDGEPIFFFSSLATHSKNIRANRKAALLVTSPTSTSTTEPLSAGRLTLMGEIVAVAPSETEQIAAGYLAVHPEANQWASFGDFAFYRLKLIDVYFVAGFGEMGWISPEAFVSVSARE